MKKNLLFIASAIFIFGNSIAQNAIPNPGFENWTTMGSYDDPNGWGTINQQVSSACFCKGTAVKSTAAEAHSGSLAIKLKTLNVILGTAPGIAATGTINTQTSQIDGGVSFTLSPDTIVGWYKYAPSGTDTGSVSITLSKWNTSTNKRDVVASAYFFQTATISSYTRFAQPLTYALPNTPDTMVVILLSSSGGSPQVNSTMFIDDLGLVYNATDIHEQSIQSLLSTFPNPASDIITFATQFSKFTLKIFDVMGKQIIHAESKVSDYRLDVSTLSEGIYYYEMISVGTEKNQSGKFLVKK